MSSSMLPLTVHNCSNDTILCRYMRQTGGRGEVRIEPRGQTMLQDGYLGMTIYASNSFDPSSSFAMLTVNQDVDDVHFTDTDGGYGRGNPVGPPASVRDVNGGATRRRRTRAKKAEPEMAQKTEVIPGDAADNHGVSLDRAHASDLTQQGNSGLVGGEAGDAEGGDGGRVFVPGMGWMNSQDIPPHVLQQLAMRERAMREAGVRQQRSEQAMFPNYDEQKVALQMDGVKLPPVKLHARTKTRAFGALTPPELFLAAKLHSVAGMTVEKSQQLARPLFFGLILLGVIGVVTWRKRTKKIAPRRRRR